MASKQTPITLKQGDSYAHTLYLTVDRPIIYKAITNIFAAAPLRIVAPSHGMLNGHRGAVTNVKGMTEINGEANALQEADWHQATVIDPDTIEFNDVNGAGFKAYVSGGVLQYNTPMDLSGYNAKMQVRDKKGGEEILFEMTVANGRIAIDTALSAVTLYFDADDLAAFTWKRGYYDLELYRDVMRGPTLVRQSYTPREGVITLEADTTK